MGSLKFLKKIRDKLDSYVREREQVREHRLSYNPTHSRTWSPKPDFEERKRRKSYDDKYRRHTDPYLCECKRMVAGNANQAGKARKGQGSTPGRRSESNLADPRQSRYVIIHPGARGRARSPRRSGSILNRKRLEYEREDILAVPPMPPIWTNENHNNAPLSPRAVNQSRQKPNPQIEEYHRLQREHLEKKKAQKQPLVDWDAIIREQNEIDRAAAQVNRQQEEKKRHLAEQKWKAAEEMRRNAEREEAEKQSQELNRQRDREETENNKQEARRRQKAAAREKADERRKAEYAEKGASEDRVKRENERRRLLAFGSPGEIEQQRRPPTWPTPSTTDGSRPQARRIEKRETASAQQKPTADNSGQQQSGQQPNPLVRRNSYPITPHQRHDSSQNRPPNLAPLTEENLRVQAADFFDDEDIDPLGRGLGDNMRTILEGFRLLTIFQSELTPSDEEEPEDKNKNKNKNKSKPHK
jgi:hypothetical protein